MDKSARLEELVRKHKSKIKIEKSDEDSKEFAETAMNELLGWYGYGAPRDDSKTRIYNSYSNSNSSGPDSPKNADGCGWCGKTVEENIGISSSSATFCSELCFSHSRRANFKKNKTCDWCKHVRHTVSYVDFQDGASQLQFCSDKCLNQYKMHIFCRETRAHLEMHPHLAGDESETSLITPDLWLKNCNNSGSRSPSPVYSPSVKDSDPQTSPLPLITLTNPAKLMAPSVEPFDSSKRQRKIQKKSRKRPTFTSTGSTDPSKYSCDEPQDLRIRPNNCSSTNGVSNQEGIDKFKYVDTIYKGDNPNQTEKLPGNVSFSLNGPEQKSSPFGSILPPVTVLVPYPIVLPIPIPIPIPLPLATFLKAMQTSNKSKEEAPTSSQKDTSDCSTSKTDSSQNNDIQRVINCSDTSLPSENEIIPVCDSSLANKIKETEVKTENLTGNQEIFIDQVNKPLRKRKRIVDVKSKIPLKSKKTLSV